jgi:uncharacterized protein (DUF952 family)
MKDLIYHITTRDSWAAAQKAGTYRADSLVKDGYIHCSSKNQLVTTANNFFLNQHGLMILVIDPERLITVIRWEKGTDDQTQLFPHIYGELNLDAVLQIVAFDPGEDGLFHLPQDLDPVE